MTIMLYRAVKTLSPGKLNDVIDSRPTLRLPSNVPYVVDNLWEVLRPSDMPCRRQAIYASPTPALAMECASRPEKRDQYTPYVVEIVGAYKIAQLVVEDARAHSDVREIQHVAQRLQASWTLMSWETRLRLSMLFAAGCSKADWERAVNEDDAAAAFADEISTLSTFWSSVRSPTLSSKGEMFFELTDGATYQLRSVDGL